MSTITLQESAREQTQANPWKVAGRTAITILAIMGVLPLLPVIGLMHLIALIEHDRDV